MVRTEIANHQTQGRPHRADRVVSTTEPLFEQLDLLSLPLIVGLEMLDLSVFLSDQFLESNYL